MKIVFKVGEASLEQAGFTPKMQEVFRQKLPEYFPESQEITLRLEKKSKGSLRWIVQGQRTRWYMKMTYGKGPCPDLGSREAAMWKFNLTQRLLNVYQVQDVFGVGSRWVTVDVLRFLEDTVTLDELLQDAIAKEKKLDEKEVVNLQKHFHAVGKNLAEKVHLVHTTEPIHDAVGTEMYQGWKLKQKDVYEDALVDILKRMNVYMPVNRKHPLVEGKDRLRLREGMKKILKGWTGKDDRLCLVHGDLNSTNSMVPLLLDSGIILIDFSPRVHLGEPRWDDGRLVGDLLQKKIETDSTLPGEVIDGFIERSEELASDSLYRQGLCFGIFSMTLLKFFWGGRPIRDVEVAKKYLDNSLRIIEQGYFS